MTDITIDNSDVKLAASIFGAMDLPPILFLHGMSLSRDTWAETAEEFAGRHCIWTLDFRGHGHSGRAASYEIADYVADAEAALAAIGRPALVVGHSLGGCVAGVLAQKQRSGLRGVLLEDPPWYLGEPAEWARSAFPRLFGIVSALQAGWQRDGAPLSTYLDFVTNAPSPMGGVSADHIGPRHLLSHASALQRQDNGCWGDVAAGVTGGKLAAIETEKPFLCPARIIQSDAKLGAALLDGHEARLAATNPQARIVAYPGCGHNVHRARAFAARFMRELEDFIATTP